MNARTPRDVRPVPRDAERLHWRTQLGVFALLISLLAQSLLTIGCGPDGLGSAVGDEVQVVAVDAPHSVIPEEYCNRCGGLRTGTGCCAHGLPLTAAIVELPGSSLALDVSALDPPLLAGRTPSSLFRPPIHT